MDTLTVVGIPTKELQERIAELEASYPSLAAENARIRAAMPLMAALGITQDEIDAALVSDCRTDPLNCGRCALLYKKIPFG